MSEPKNVGGAPTKFTDETKEKILLAIRKGAPYELACNSARIDYTTLLNWRRKAENDKLPAYIKFFEDLKEAEGHTALKWLDVIDKAMIDGSWQPAAWKLERRHAKHYSAQAAIIEMNERLERLEKGEVDEKTTRDNDASLDEREA